MLVGHEPDFSNEIARLTGAKAKMRKGGLAIVDGSTLLALLRPSELAAIAAQGPSRRQRSCPDRSWEVKRPGHVFRRALATRRIVYQTSTAQGSNSSLRSLIDVTNTRHLCHCI